MPTPEDLMMDTFLTDTAQNPDEQSQNENAALEEGSGGRRVVCVRCGPGDLAELAKL